MKEETLAENAVKITQIIKSNLSKEPQEIITLVLNECPELDVDGAEAYLFSMGDSFGIRYKDINDLIKKVTELFKNAVSDVDWNTLCQNLAQGLYYAALILSNLLPPKWAQIVRIVLDAYEKLIIS